MTKKQKRIIWIFLINTFILTVMFFLGAALPHPYKAPWVAKVLLIITFASIAVFLWLCTQMKTIMPVVISVNDTVEKLHRQRVLFSIAWIVFWGIRFLPFQNILTSLLYSMGVPAMMFGTLTIFKEEYLMNKPEGV